MRVPPELIREILNYGSLLNMLTFSFASKLMYERVRKQLQLFTLFDICGMAIKDDNIAVFKRLRLYLPIDYLYLLAEYRPQQIVEFLRGVKLFTPDILNQNNIIVLKSLEQSLNVGADTRAFAESKKTDLVNLLYLNCDADNSMVFTKVFTAMTTTVKRATLLELFNFSAYNVNIGSRLIKILKNQAIFQPISEFCQQTVSARSRRRQIDTIEIDNSLLTAIDCALILDYLFSPKDNNPAAATLLKILKLLAAIAHPRKTPEQYMKDNQAKVSLLRFLTGHSREIPTDRQVGIRPVHLGTSKVMATYVTATTGLRRPVIHGLAYIAGQPAPATPKEVPSQNTPNTVPSQPSEKHDDSSTGTDSSDEDDTDSDNEIINPLQALFSSLFGFVDDSDEDEDQLDLSDEHIETSLLITEPACELTRANLELTRKLMIRTPGVGTSPNRFEEIGKLIVSHQFQTDNLYRHPLLKMVKVLSQVGHVKIEDPIDVLLSPDWAVVRSCTDTLYDHPHSCILRSYLEKQGYSFANYDNLYKFGKDQFTYPRPQTPTPSI